MIIGVSEKIPTIVKKQTQLFYIVESEVLTKHGYNCFVGDDETGFIEFEEIDRLERETVSMHTVPLYFEDENFVAFFCHEPDRKLAMLQEETWHFNRESRDDNEAEWRCHVMSIYNDIKAELLIALGR